MISWDGKCLDCHLDFQTHKEYIRKYGFIRVAIPPKLTANFFTTDPLPLETVDIKYKDCFRFRKPLHLEISDFLNGLD